MKSKRDLLVLSEEEQKVPTLTDAVKSTMIRALEVTKGNVARASALVDAGRATFYRDMKKFQIDPRNYR